MRRLATGQDFLTMSGAQMGSRKYWIELPQEAPGRLAILARPLGGDRLQEELADWARVGMSVVASLLTDDEIAELDLHDEERMCADLRVEFHRFPIDDRGVPTSFREMYVLVEQLHGRLMNGQSIGIHCRAGIGRSALVAACIVCRLGIDSDSAFKLISQARGVGVPDTPEQREWVKAFVAPR